MKDGKVTENFTVGCGEKIIPVVLTRKRVKNINLRIKRNLSVAVSAAEHVPLEVIVNLIRKKSSWIFKHFELYANRQEKPPECLYNSGNQLSYLGRTYLLQVQPALQGEEVLLDGENLYLLTRDAEEKDHVEKLVNRWYHEKAGDLFSLSLERIFPLLERFGLQKPSLTIRKMKTRWGSCSRKLNRITLNTELVKKPLPCIDYVVLHELLHFIHPNHGRQFYQLLAELMPDWQELKKLLKET